MKKIILLVAVTAFLAGCQTTNDKLETIAKQGSVVSGTYAAANGRVKVPLPDGNWTVAGSGYGRAGYENPIEEVMLVQVNDGVATGFVEIRSPAAMSGRGFVRSSFCERKDIHYLKRSANADGKQQDCWGVNHFSMTLSGDIPQFLDETRSYVVSNKIKSPLNALAVTYNLADRSYFVEVIYFFNPEVEGFAPPEIAEWATSDWHRDRVYLDPDKVAYIEKLKDWGRDWYPKVKAGFEGDLSSVAAKLN